ncbi:fungal hydrophobin [Suillus ampliporus]|nr:fungal hydrophobin [Suillus ampliporus]KAG0707994.1 fungal hydrophobin [Suillus ampliporus]
MFARLFAVASLVVFAVATPTGSGSSQCNTGSIQCCQSSSTVQQFNALAPLLGLIPIVADVTALLGFGCSPLTVVGTGSGCVANQEPLCCTGNAYNGLVNIGCSPINLNL